MPVSKQSLSGPPNAVKSDDANDPLDIFIRQAISKETSPLQYVQLVHPLGHLGLSTWPLLTPLRLQLLKCDKCSKEFCSPMNYRRHILMHRRSSNADKESHKNRDVLGAFFDNLSVEEAGRIASFDDISLEGVPGSLIVDAWASSIHKAGILILPQVYLHAGCILLEIIQAKSSRPPISSQEVFSILDETSEGTFLSAGTAESVQKFVVDGGAEKALELRNLVATIGLLFEQKLEKAWLAEKDAEALRCQKILVEEEEAAQKRQSQALERKRRKKLRQKEQKARGPPTGEKTDINADSSDSIADFVEGPASAETSIPKVLSDNGPDTLTDLKPSLEQIDFTGKEEEIVEASSDNNSTHVGVGSMKNVGSPREWATNGLYQPSINTWKVVKSYRRGQVALLGSQNLQASKLEGMQKQGPANEMNIVANRGNIWARRSKSAIDEWSSRITVQNKVAKTANDVGSSKTSLQHIVAKGAIDIESSRTTLQNVVAKGSNDDESSRTSLRNIVSKGETDVENSRTMQIVVAKSAIDLESSRTSLQNVTKGAIDVESSRTTLQNLVAKGANDVESSRTSSQNVAKGATDVESSRTTLQNVVAESTNDVRGSRTSLQNTVSIGAIDVENSRTTLQNVVAKSANDERDSRTSLQNTVSKGAIDVENSRTTLRNVVAKSANDERGSRTSLQNTVSKGAIDVENSRTTLQNVVAKTANDVESSRTSLRKVEKGAIDVVSSKTTLQNIVAKSAKDVESSRTSLQSVVPSHIDPSNCKLLIGSISVPVGDYTAEQHVSQGETTDTSDNSEKSDVILKGKDPAVAMTGNICVYQMRGNLHIQLRKENCGEKGIQETVEDQTATRLQSSVSKPNVTISVNKNPYTERNVQLAGSVFPNFDVKAFLSQRWEDAISSDHVKLVLSPEPPRDADGRKDCSLLVQTSGCSQYSKLGDAETSVAAAESRISFTKKNSKAKFRKKDKKRRKQDEA